MADAYGHPYARYVLERQEQWQRSELLLTVFRLFYHMSNIFRDNAPTIPAQPRLHIDRKGVRELRELRITLGHQPDDHEEEQTKAWGGMTMKSGKMQIPVSCAPTSADGSLHQMVRKCINKTKHNR